MPAAPGAKLGVTPQMPPLAAYRADQHHSPLDTPVSVPVLGAYLHSGTPHVMPPVGLTERLPLIGRTRPVAGLSVAGTSALLTTAYTAAYGRVPIHRRLLGVGVGRADCHPG